MVVGCDGCYCCFVVDFGWVCVYCMFVRIIDGCGEGKGGLV